MILIAIFIMCKILFEFFQMFRIVTNTGRRRPITTTKQLAHKRNGYEKRLWVLHPLLLASTLPALAAQSDEDSIIVSANRTHRTVAEMAQTTGSLRAGD